MLSVQVVAAFVSFIYVVFITKIVIIVEHLCVRACLCVRVINLVQDSQYNIFYSIHMFISNVTPHFKVKQTSTPKQNTVFFCFWFLLKQAF